jgi:pyridoxamine 5'-phosphate oxidase
MNEKNSFGLDNCFLELENPIELFAEWFKEAQKTEINDPNAVAIATVNKSYIPSVRMVLLKDFNKDGFIFYTNLDSKKSKDMKENPNVSMCFHWKSILRQIRIVGKVKIVSDKDADDYYKSRAYGSRIGAWASKQSSVLEKREDLIKAIDSFKKKYPDENNVPRPSYWSGWILTPNEIEFWLDGKNRIHERLKYKKRENDSWERFLLNP